MGGGGGGGGGAVVAWWHATPELTHSLCRTQSRNDMNVHRVSRGWVCGLVGGRGEGGREAEMGPLTWGPYMSHVDFKKE